MKVVQLVFEMRFAKAFFNYKVAEIANGVQSFGFAFYRISGGFNYKPNWLTTQKRNFIIKTVNKLMDIVYLHRNFLEIYERGGAREASAHSIAPTSPP